MANLQAQNNMLLQQQQLLATMCSQQLKSFNKQLKSFDILSRSFRDLNAQALAQQQYQSSYATAPPVQHGSSTTANAAVVQLPVINTSTHDASSVQQLLQIQFDPIVSILPVAVQQPRAMINTFTHAVSSVQRPVVNNSTSGPAPAPAVQPQTDIIFSASDALTVAQLAQAVVNTSTSVPGPTRAPAVQPQTGVNISVFAPAAQLQFDVSYPGNFQTPADPAYSRDFYALRDAHERTKKKPIIVPGALELKKSLDQPTPLLRLPHEIMDNVVKYLPPKDVISLAKTCRSSFVSMSDSVAHFMSISSPAFGHADSRHRGEEANPNTSATLKSWALFTSDFLDEVCDGTRRISHVTIKCRRNQRFIGMDGYASLRAALRQNEFRSITQLTIVGKVHISTQHLLFVLPSLAKLRNLVVSEVPSIDPYLFLREVVLMHGENMTVDFTPIMPENIGAFEEWYEDRFKYFGELYFMILPYAKKYMPTLLAPGSGLYNFLLGTFCGDNGIESTAYTGIRAFMSELYLLAPEPSRDMAGTIDAGAYSDVQRRFSTVSWIRSNRAYVDAARKLIRTIATNWKVSQASRVDVVFCTRHGFVFHMLWPRCRHSRFQICWLHTVEQSYKSMHVHDRDAADIREQWSKFVDPNTTDQAYDIGAPSILPFSMPLVDEADPVAPSETISDNLPSEPVADSIQDMSS